MLAHQPSVSSIVAACSDQASCTALVTGPGTGSSTSSHALTGCASLVVDARKTSLAPRTTSIGSSTSPPPDPSRTPPPLHPPPAAVPLEDEPPRHTGQAPALERRRAQLAVDDVEDVGPCALAEVPGQVGH